MKKAFVLLSVFSLCILCLSAQENRSWHLGVQYRKLSNKSRFDGGMADANARFKQTSSKGRAFGLIARYDLNKHWMLMTGVGYNSLGFSFKISEDYSFTQRSKRHTRLNLRFRAVEIPLMVAYKSNPNCGNWRWVMGAGINSMITYNQNQHRSSNRSSYNGDYTGNISSQSVIDSVMEGESITKSGAYIQARFMLGREKVFKKGNMLNVSLLINRGFTEIARAVVNYTIDGNNYSHEFSNKGSYACLSVTYYFRSFNGNKQN